MKTYFGKSKPGSSFLPVSYNAGQQLTGSNLGDAVYLLHRPRRHSNTGVRLFLGVCKLLTRLTNCNYLMLS